MGAVQWDEITVEPLVEILAGLIPAIECLLVQIGNISDIRILGYNIDDTVGPFLAWYRGTRDDGRGQAKGPIQFNTRPLNIGILVWRKLRHLGSRQSRKLFRTKLQALEISIQRVIGPLQPYGAELVYPTVSFSLGSSDNTSELRDRRGAWTWFEYGSTDGFHPGLAGGLDSIESVLKSSGPFDGIVGFSEGAAAANVLASLLEEKRKHAFAQLEGEGEISYASCFATFDRPPSQVRAMHSLRNLESVVDEIASMRFVESCQELEDEKNPNITWHAGGHMIPSGKRELTTVGQFIKFNGS